MPDSTGLSLYIPPLLSQSFFPDLRKLASLYKTLRPYLLLPNPRTPWSQYSFLFSSIFSISRAHLDLFPLPAACIRNIIPRYSSDFVFEKLHSAVYLIWSPFSKHFYIGSFDRVLDTSAFQRFSEHLKNAFQPRSNSTSLYVHTKMRAQPGIWCVAIVKANPEDAAAYEKTLDIAERQRVHAIFDQLENIYPATLTLELTGTGSTDFLETSVSYPTLPTSITQLQDPTSDSAHSFSTRNLNKNRLSLNAPLRKFARLQHSLSYRHAQQVRGALTGTFLRLPRHSSSTTTAFFSSIELLAELHLLDFQPATLTRTLRKLSFCHPNPLWSHLLCLLSLRSYTTFISSFIRSLPT